MTTAALAPGTPPVAPRIHPDTLGRPAPAVPRNPSPLSASHTSATSHATATTATTTATAYTAQSSPPTPPRALSRAPSASGASPRRSPSLKTAQPSDHSPRRKPVPSLLSVDTAPAPSSLPSSHPFAPTSKAGAGAASVRSMQSVRSAQSARSSETGSPATPSYARVEDDLFFAPPRLATPPPPPRRPAPASRPGRTDGYQTMSAADAAAAADDAGAGTDEPAARPSTFHGLSDGGTATVPQIAVEAGMLDARANEAIPTPTESEGATPLSESPPASPASPLEASPPRPISVDHPLPPLPADARSISTMSTGPGLATPSTAPVIAFDAASTGPRSPKGPKLSKPVKAPKPAKVPRKSMLIPPEPREDEEFSVDRLPSRRRLWEAGTMFLRDERGKLVCFGDLFPRWDDAASAAAALADPLNPPRKPRTVAFFIRHFWCGQCQDFMFASVSQLDPAALEAANIRVVIISNGSWKIIKKYRELFKCPFPIYVDGPRRLYSLLGMIKMTNDFGPMKGRAAYHQRPVPTQLLHGLGNAFFRMPLANPGKLTQLGGEFVLSPGFECDFAHRMTTTSDHMEAPDVLRLAGCEHPTRNEAAQIELEESQRAELEQLEVEMETWRTGRETELDRIRRKKAARRGVEYVPPSRPLSGLYGAPGLDAELNEGWEYGGPVDVVALPGSNGHAALGRVGSGAGAGAGALDHDDVEEDDDDVDRDEMDKRFERVMALERERERARVAAAGNEANGAHGGLDVEVEP